MAQESTWTAIAAAAEATAASASSAADQATAVGPSLGALVLTSVTSLASRASKLSQFVENQDGPELLKSSTKLLQKTKEAVFACAEKPFEGDLNELLEAVTKLQGLVEDLLEATADEEAKGGGEAGGGAYGSMAELKARIARAKGGGAPREGDEKEQAQDDAAGAEEGATPAGPGSDEGEPLTLQLETPDPLGGGGDSVLGGDSISSLEGSADPATEAANKAAAAEEEKRAQQAAEEASARAEEERKANEERLQKEAEERQRLQKIKEEEERVRQAELEEQRRIEKERFEKEERRRAEAQAKALARQNQGAGALKERRKLVRDARETLKRELLPGAQEVSTNEARSSLAAKIAAFGEKEQLSMRLRRRAVQQAVVVKASASALSAVSSTKPKESAVPFWKQAALIAAKEEKKLQKKLAKAAAKAEAAAEAEASLASASHASEDGSSLPPVSRPNSSRGKRGDGKDAKKNIPWWEATYAVEPPAAAAEASTPPKTAEQLFAEGLNSAEVSPPVVEAEQRPQPPQQEVGGSAEAAATKSLAAMASSAPSAAVRRQGDLHRRAQERQQLEAVAGGLAKEYLDRKKEHHAQHLHDQEEDGDTLNFGLRAVKSTGDQFGLLLNDDAGAPIIQVNTQMAMRRKRRAAGGGTFLADQLQGAEILSSLEQMELDNQERLLQKIVDEAENAKQEAIAKAERAKLAKEAAEKAARMFETGEGVIKRLKQKKPKARGRLATLILGRKKDDLKKAAEKVADKPADSAAADGEAGANAPEGEGSAASEEKGNDADATPAKKTSLFGKMQAAAANAGKGALARRARRTGTFGIPDEPQGGEALGPGSPDGTISQLLECWVWLQISRSPEHAGGPTHMDPVVCAQFLRRKNVAPPLPASMAGVVERSWGRTLPPALDGLDAAQLATRMSDSEVAKLNANEPGADPEVAAAEPPEVLRTWAEQTVRRAADMVKLTQACLFDKEAKAHVMKLTLRASASFSGSTPPWSEERIRMETEYAKLCAATAPDEAKPEHLRVVDKYALYGKAILATALQRPTDEVTDALLAAAKVFPRRPLPRPPAPPEEGETPAAKAPKVFFGKKKKKPVEGAEEGDEKKKKSKDAEESKSGEATDGGTSAAASPGAASEEKKKKEEEEEEEEGEEKKKNEGEEKEKEKATATEKANERRGDAGPKGPESHLVYEMAMLDVAALEENPSNLEAWHSAESRLREAVARATEEKIADQADERRLLLRCRLELAVLRFQSRDDKGVTADDRLDLEAELQEVLRLHSPPADRYDAAPLAAPLAEVDELHCMLAQLALGRSDNGTAKVHYRELGRARATPRAYPATRRLINLGDWPEADRKMPWIDPACDDMA